MDKNHFDDVARTIAVSRTSRRKLIRMLASGAGAAVLTRVRFGAAAQAAGCRTLDERCKDDRQCCSGRCRGPQGAKTCHAHHVGARTAGQSFCRQGSAATCNGQRGCTCFVTTGNAGFRGRSLACVACQRDADCEAQGFPPGAACVRRDGPVCECETSTLCVAPCAAFLLTSAGAGS